MKAPISIKRPLVYIFASYLFGLLSNKMPLAVEALILVFAYVSIYFFRHYLHRLCIDTKSYVIVITIPLVMFAGYLSINNQLKLLPIEYLIQEKTSVQLSGRVNNIKITDETMSIELGQTEIKCGGSSFNHINIILYTNYDEDIKIGNILSSEADIVPVKKATNPGQFDMYMYYLADGVRFSAFADNVTITEKKTNVLRQKSYELKIKIGNIYKELLPEKSAGILCALLLGDKTTLDDETQKLYRVSGIAHVLSISGLHCSLIGMGLYTILRKIKSPFILAVILTMLGMASYGLLTGYGLSTIRAVSMLFIALTAKLTGRTYDIRSAAALCALIMLWISPAQIYTSSFQLSYSAVFGIAYAGDVNKQIFSGSAAKKSTFIKFLPGLLISMGVQLATLPFLRAAFYEIPLYSIITNLLVVPLLSLVVVIGLAAGAVGLVCIPVARFVIGGVYYILEMYEVICNLQQKLPFHTLLLGKAKNWQNLLYAVLLIMALLAAKKLVKCKKLLALVPLALLPLALMCVKDNENYVTFLDVGQGDSIFISAEDKNILIDCGSSDIAGIGEYRLIPFLKAQGIYSLSAIFVSHTDIDHVSGIIQLLENITDTVPVTQLSYKGFIGIETIYLPQVTDKNTNYTKIIELAERNNISVVYLNRGDTLKSDKLSIHCLNPDDNCKESQNETSMVLYMECEDFDILLTGDITENEETEIINYMNVCGLSGNIDLLKVGHHGSKYSSTSEFLTYLMPETAVISCGKNNSYGHPHMDTIERIQAVGSNIYFTMKNGAVTIYKKGDLLIAETFS